MMVGRNEAWSEVIHGYRWRKNHNSIHGFEPDITPLNLNTHKQIKRTNRSISPLIACLIVMRLRGMEPGPKRFQEFLQLIVIISEAVSSQPTFPSTPHYFSPLLWENPTSTSCLFIHNHKYLVNFFFNLNFKYIMFEGVVVS